MVLMALAPNQPFAFVIGVALGVCSIAFLTASTAIVQIEAAPEMRGRVLALQAMLFLGARRSAAPSSVVSQEFGARYAIGLGGAPPSPPARGATPGPEPSAPGRRRCPRTAPMSSWTARRSRRPTRMSVPRSASERLARERVDARERIDFAAGEAPRLPHRTAERDDAATAKCSGASTSALTSASCGWASS